MQQNILHKTILFLGLLLLFSACSVKKYIPEGEVLYKKTSFSITSVGKVKNAKIEEEIAAVIRPSPNSKFLGSRISLWTYYKAQKEKPNFLIKYLNKKIGEKPIYLSSLNLERTEQLVLNRLENKGYFYSSVQLSKNDSTGKVLCTATVKQPYTMQSYQVASDSLKIYDEIKKSLPKSELKIGQQFDIENFKSERQRVDNELKSKGYYNFNADFLIFEIDTTSAKGKRFDLYVRLKKDLPNEALVPYNISKILVYPNYSIDNSEKQVDTATVNGIQFLQDSIFFLPERLEPFILLEKNQVYNPSISRRTSNRLSSIGSYKFVNIQFETSELTDTSTNGFLTSYIYLSPLKKKALRFELQGVTKSNSFAGPSLALTHTNRNLFKGGEVLNISGEFGYEKQFFNTQSEGLRSTQIGLKIDLLFPRLLFPIELNNNFKYTIPKTKISAGIDILNRSQLYQLTSFNTSFGYQWKASRYVFHEINPISANYVKLGNSTSEFDEILNDNAFLRSSFEQELIAGLTYNFTYSQLNNSKKKNPIFLSTNLDVAGNGVSLIGSESNTNNTQTFLGIEYAQYAKLDADLRYYMKTGDQQTLVTRVFAGCGLAYGNSTTLPFSKQYFSGGPYSIRAFRIRALGPGTYNSNDNSSFFDQSGDVRLEANLEYRFPVFSFLKGALFMDAGNVWLINENEALPGGKFSSNFMNELGIGTGFGMRIDIQSFVIRFDLATPIQKPYGANRSQLKLHLEDTILNFALGYPF